MKKVLNGRVIQKVDDKRESFVENTILFETNETEYQFVAENIYIVDTKESDDKILSYDKKGTEQYFISFCLWRKIIYVLAHKKYIPHSLIKEKGLKNQDEKCEPCDYPHEMDKMLKCFDDDEM